MKWHIIELHVDGVIHRANYRVVGDTLEVTASFGQSRRPKGPLRAELAAREVLRKMVKRAPEAA